MNYSLVKDLLSLVEHFESENSLNIQELNVENFLEWSWEKKAQKKINYEKETLWEGKESGRSPESVISTLFVRLNRYAKKYSKAAISHSDFSTQDDFIYLISLRTSGPMTKTQLIKKNIHDKSAGNLIITRLLQRGWVQQENSSFDNRAKVLCITETGIDVLEGQMRKIRLATQIVSGNLNESEKIELIRLLNKLTKFHEQIWDQNPPSENLLDFVDKQYMIAN